MTPKRIQRSRAKGWRMPENAVDVARPGPWGNPFKVGRDGSRGKCAELYRTMLGGWTCITSGPTADEQITARRHMVEHPDELRGKDLACWCRLDGKPCHGAVLLELANS